MKDFVKKLRIQTYDPEFNQLDDRLVIQDPELKNGPKEVHNGPMKIEVCLLDSRDVSLFQEYLDKLKGNLPLEKKERRKKAKVRNDKSFAENFIAQVSELETAIVFSQLVKESGFIFTSAQLMEDMDLPIAIPEDILLEDYRILVRLLKKAKNPLNNKYDVSLILLIPHVGSTVKIFLLGELALEKTFEGLDSKKVKVPRSLSTRFPSYMIADDRRKFTVERYKLESEPESAPSSFYKRWVHFVAEVNKGKGIIFPKIDEIERPY